MFSMEVNWTPGQKYPGIERISSDDSVGTWLPDDGFDWKDKSDTSQGVVWKAGVKSRNFPNIVTSLVKDAWLPFPGYSFQSTSPSYPDNLAVVWSPGSKWPAWPNIYAASQEGVWLPDAGYRFVDPAKSLAVEPIVDIFGSSTAEPGDTAAVHFGTALLLEACPDANEDSWAITKILSEACDRAQAKEIGFGIDHVLNGK